MIRSNSIEQLPEIIEDLRKHASFMNSAGGDYHVAMLLLTPETFAGSGISEPATIPGLSFILLTEGEIEMELNTELHTISANSILVTDSRTVQKISAVRSPSARLYLLSLTPEFIRNLNIDINVLQHAHLRTSTEPFITRQLKESSILVGYMEMLNENALTNPANTLYTKNISRSLIAALIYQMMQIANSRYVSDVSNRMEKKSENGNRRMNYVKSFMELVHQYYSTERSLGFYADKLCISPKYLSAVIKECTNRSAAEWIDEYVMLEAKNMLRFSGMNIQQVAYALNFRNQSAFGKYFKHLAGMSPSQFQKQ